MIRATIVFPGLGSQCVGMGKTLCEEYQEAREVYEEAGDILHIDMRRICSEGTIGELFKPDIAQLALFTTGMALYRTCLAAYDIKPVVMAGHSMGEYTALVAANVIKFSDALHIIRHRSKLTKEMIDAGTGSMAIVDGLSYKQAEAFCLECSDKDSYAVVSCYNSPEQVALSGHIGAMVKVERKILECSTANVSPIYASAPFHSEIMRNMAEELKTELQKLKFNKSEIDVLSNVSGLPYRNEREVTKLLYEQLLKPVRWMHIMDYMIYKNVDYVIEMSSLSVLRNLIKPYCNVETYSFGQKETRKELQNILENKNSTGQVLELNRVIPHILGKATSTKNYEYDIENYKNNVQKPYELLKELYLKNKSHDLKTDIQEVSKALELLKTILNGKKIDRMEQDKIFASIHQRTRIKNLFHPS